MIISIVSADYWSLRQDFINNEQKLSVGSNLKLTQTEEQVNKILIEAKQEEMNNGFLHPEDFSPALHFFKAKTKIEASKVFSFIKKMPKGGGLHLHDTCLTSLDYIITNITYRDHLYACIEDDNLKTLIFSNKTPEETCWKSVKTLRQTEENFDVWLKSQLNMLVPNPEEMYPDINTVWKKFEGIFSIITPMLTYYPVWIDYYYQGLKELYEDNVNYAEIRGTLPEVYDLDERKYNQIEVFDILKKTSDKFMVNFPDFLGVKYIYAPGRHVEENVVEDYLILYKQLKELHPNFLIGFDLVNQEDKGYPLTKFINQLTSELSNDVRFFFHSGETNWYGMPTDNNLIDAILLNTTRIGHGFALTKHPEVMKVIKQRGIGIEVNPISNQVLKLVADMRNHPAASLIADDFPVVISSDAPGFWEATGLSHDFYEAFMGMSSASSDLKLLKQLAVNSLLYSGLEPIEKGEILMKFDMLWKKFVDNFVNLYSFK